MTVTAGNDSAAEGILAVAGRLFAARGFANVTVRDIADAAGVTHPLIYYHWGSKSRLYAAVIERFQQGVRSVAAAQSDPEETIHAIVRHYLSDGRAYLLTMVQAFLTDMPVGDWPGGYPGLTALLGAMRDAAPGDDPAWDEEGRSAVALLVALVVGWVIVGDKIMDIAEFAPDERQAASERVVQAVDMILRDPLTRTPS